MNALKANERNFANPDDEEKEKDDLNHLMNIQEVVRGQQHRLRILIYIQEIVMGHHRISIRTFIHIAPSEWALWLPF